ncbi:ABC transporter ATP-binding protein [Bacillus salinus]|uniref:ABC transporter ATP-binding protein n=1 Tax=Bacillus sp. HMF5848 TaxID=2495421 RepID=UPI00163AB1BE|nr:ABC transporter ATP-binding protein [Bacillus sp. HMF5848]
MSDIIVCKNIIYKAGHETILEIDSFSAKQGEQIVLMGPSGSGKTTFLKLLSGLLQPTTGNVNVCNEPLHEQGDAERLKFRAEKIGMVFQEFRLFPFMTALDNVLVQQLTRSKQQANIDKSKATELLINMGLENRIHHKVGVLSRGQQQRVAIARALIHEPSVLLVDEPTSNLDVRTGLNMMSLLQDYSSKTNATLITVTHDTHIADRFEKQMKMEHINKVYQQAIAEVSQ